MAKDWQASVSEESVKTLLPMEGRGGVDRNKPEEPAKCWVMSWNVKTAQAANKLDLVDFLQTQGFSPKRVNKDDYWYCSPLRDERTPSFKVNRKLNAWYDHGSGKGGSVVDFGIEFYGYTVKEFLQ